jgi:hypothetical protein
MTNKKALVTISLRMEEPDKQKLEWICKKMKSNKSKIVRDNLKMFLNAFNKL